MTLKNENLNSINWSVIPALVIEKIYNHLDISDKKNMSLVCKYWWKMMLPELWKFFTLNLFDRSSATDFWPELELANKYGHMFRHIKINTIGYSKNASKLCMQLGMFFEALSSKTQLVSFGLQHVDFLILKFTENEQKNVFLCILSFIRTQYELENVTLTSIYLNHEDGMELLNTLCNNCHNLKTLHLYKFLKITNNYARNPNSLQTYKNLALKFINLQKLGMDYSKMFENIFSSYQELEYDARLPKRLFEVAVLYNGIRICNCDGIPPTAWKVLQKLCPDLKVHVIISYPIFRSVEKYFVQFMPVFKLSIIGEHFYEFDFDKLVQRIISTEIANHIEWVDISYLSQFDCQSPCLMPFFNACSKLLGITIEEEAEGIEDLLQSLLNNRHPNLKYLNIQVLCTNVDDFQRCMYLSAKYLRSFEASGLALLLNGGIKS